MGRYTDPIGCTAIDIQSPECPAVHTDREMPLVSALLVGSVLGVCVLGSALLGIVRNNNNNKEEVKEGRRSSHVTEVLQVDMIDRKIRMTSIDCSLDMMKEVVKTHKADQILQSVA